MRFFLCYCGVLIGLLMTHSHYAQNLEDFDPLATRKGESKFFLRFQENLFQEDAFSDEITKKEKETTLSYYRVFFNSNEHPQTLGFYTSKYDEDLGVKVTRISQQVNRDLIPYFTINYTYHPDNENLLSSKILKDKFGRITGSYYYYWYTQNAKLKKIERYGQTEYLYQTELKNYLTLRWNKDALNTLTLFNKKKAPIEKYTFKSSFDIKSPLSTEIPEYAVGNENVLITHLERYERYEKNSHSKKSYYIDFQETDENSFLEQQYRGDGVLFQEKFHKSIPQQKSS